MARTESEQLVFSVEARIAAMEKQMARAGRVTDKTFTGMENRSKRAARTMEKEMASGAARVGSVMKTFGRGFLGGIAAGGVAGVVSSFAKVAASIAEIGDEAKRAGLDVKAFQQLKYVAEQNRIGVDSLVDGMKELNLRADEFIMAGGGSAADAFQRLGYSAEELKGKLKDPSALFTEIIGKLEKLDKAARIRIADEVFGGSGGEKFVQLIDLGEQGIRDQIRAANDLGAVMDERLIAKATELDRAFKTVSTTVSTYLQGAIIRAADDLWSFIEMFQKWESVRKGTVDARLAAIGKERLALEKRILETRHEQSGITDNARDLGFGSSTSGVYSGQAEEVARLQQQMKLLADEEDRILAARKGIDDLPTKVVPSTATAPSIVPDSSGNGGGRGKAASAVEREAEAVRRLIAELQEELRLVGASSSEREIATTLRRANVDAASAEGQQIAALIMEIGRETDALEKNRQAQEARTQAIEGMFDMGADALMSIVDGSMKAEDAVKKLAVQLALAAAQAAILGSGPLAGLFGGGVNYGALSASGKYLFDSGGYTGDGGKNQPAGVVHKGEVVWSQKDVARAGGVRVVEAMRKGMAGYAGGGPVAIPAIQNIQMPRMPSLTGLGGQQRNGRGTVNINVNVSGANGDQHVIDLVQQGVRRGLGEYDKQIPSKVVHSIKDARRRGVQL